MEYEKEFIAKITGMGTLGYDVEKIINVLDVEQAEEFRKDFANKDSEIHKAFQKGVDKSDYIIDYCSGDCGFLTWQLRFSTTKKSSSMACS